VRTSRFSPLFYFFFSILLGFPAHGSALHQRLHLYGAAFLAWTQLSVKIVPILPESSKTSRPPLLALHDVTVMRGESTKKPALDRVSLRIEAGEHVCILGPNGCGKSTLIKTITRECYPMAHEGSSISILGRELWNIFELRSLLGIVSPDLLASCTTDATGRDVVLSGFFSSTRIFPHHHPDPGHLARAEATLDRLGIAHLANRAVSRMSSGEAKRTLIARALVHDPRTLLFDEPGNALDIAAQFQLRDTMRQLAQSGLGILLVTHHVSEIIPEIERVVFLREGRILADGPKQHILTAGRLCSLFGVPVRLVQQDGYFHLY
jgi:iron complex transport system ATP-binding protein